MTTKPKKISGAAKLVPHKESAVGAGPAEAEWSNDVIEPTPREEQLAELAEKDKAIKAVSYTVTSKNAKAIRIIHDYFGTAITIPPLETRHGVWLRPHTAKYLGNLDLELAESK